MLSQGSTATAAEISVHASDSQAFVDPNESLSDIWLADPDAPDYEQLFHQIDGSWRAGGAHLSRAPSGLWYMRLKVPDSVRAAYPHLPKELRRSTKTRHKIHALGISRKMCLDFLIRHRISEKSMAQPDKQAQEHAQSPDQQFSFSVINGEVRTQLPPNADLKTLQLAFQGAQALQRAFAANDACFQSQVMAVPSPSSAPIEVTGIASSSSTEVQPPPQQVQEAACPPVSPEKSDFVDCNQDNPLAPEWLSEAIEHWRTEGPTKFSDESWKHSYASTFRIVREIIGTERRTRTLHDGSVEANVPDIRLKDLRPHHIAQLHDALKKLPPNQGHNTAVVEALVRIRHRERNRQPLPSPHSVDKKLGHVAPFIKFAKQAQWVKAEALDAMELARKTAATQLIKSERKKGGKTGYVALSADELKRVFAQEALIENARQRPWQYWVPLLCLYQGVRVSEASQLYTDDIKIIDGVPCISFIEDTQGDQDDKPACFAASAEEYRRLKTASSRRVVPLHPKLIELGFSDFVQGVQQRHPGKAMHLFAGLTWDTKNGFGRKPSRFFIEQLKAVGAHEPRRKVMHSLRSNFNQELGRTMLPSDLISRLLGHTTGKMKDERYNETEYGPSLPFARIVPYLAQMDFGLTLPSWHEVTGH